MSEQQYNWEADVRQKVEQHEFDFDPAAWAAMEELLDGGVAPGATNAASAAATTSVSTLLKWAIILLVAATLAFVLLRKTPASDTLEEPTETPTEQLESQLEEIEPTEAVGQMTLSEENTKYRSDFAPKDQKRMVEPLAPLPPIWQEVRRLPARQDAYTTSFLPKRVLIPLPDSLGSKDPLPEVQLPNEKRNRKTLFPDVLNQY